MFCYEKQRHATLRVATLEAVGQLDKYGPQRPYACDRCSGYHLTTATMDGRSITAEMVLALAASMGVGR